MDYIFIDKTIKTSIYKQIASSISDAIDRGRLTYNDKLPTEKEICEVFGVSQTAVKMAYQQLIDQGKIKRIKGKGTFVTNRSTYHQDFLNVYQFESNPENEIQDILFDCVDDEYMIKRMLKMDSDESFCVIHRIIKSNQNPLLYQHIYLPEKHYPKLKKNYLANVRVFSLIQEIYHHQIHHIQNTFSPTLASSAEAQILNILPGEAIYLIRSQIYNTHQNVIGYIVNYFPGEFSSFEVTVHAKP
jgi:GntR family transcriptional regulator